MFFHIQNEEYTHLSCLLLPAHYCYDRYFLSRQYYEQHTFYRKHFWRFTTFRTKNMHTYLVCCCQRTIATIDISFRHEFIVKHFWCFSTFRTKNIHIHVCCVLLPEHTCYDRYSHSSKYYEPHAFYRKHFWCFPHLERRIYTYMLCVAVRAHLLRSIFPFEQVL